MKGQQADNADSGGGSVTTIELLTEGRRDRLWHGGRTVKGTVQFLISRGGLESVEVEDLAASADALIGRAAPRVEATAAAALNAGDLDGAYVAAYDAYLMAAELLVRQGLRATGGDGSHMAVEDAVYRRAV